MWEFETSLSESKYWNIEAAQAGQDSLFFVILQTRPAAGAFDEW
jgi:hypothetical protein